MNNMTDVINNTNQNFIEIKKLYKIFGAQPKSILPMLEKGVSKEDIMAQTGHSVGLQNINLDIKRGELFVIMGLSGSGKSTLIRHINRLIDPTFGEVLVEGKNIIDLPLKELRQFRRQRMSMVFQRFALMPHKTVLDNVAYGLKVQGVKISERRKASLKWMEAVGLEGYSDQYPTQLSGGQQQRVGLARALATNADIMLMDEAFSALDPLIRSDMQQQLTKLQNDLHKTIIFITHDLDEALRIGDRIAILKDGKLIQVGTPVEILLNPADDYVEAFVKDVNRLRALSVDTFSVALKQPYPLPESKKDLAVKRKDNIESIIPKILKSQEPVPVVDDNNNVIGELTDQSLIDFFEEHVNTAD